MASGGPTRPRWLVVQHARHEGPGLIAETVADAGGDLVVCQPRGGDPLPTPAEVAAFDAVAVLGGAMGVHDGARYPWLVDERVLLEAAVGADKVVLGVCLGAQQLAAALGAEVETDRPLEVGAGSVRLTDEGAADPVLGPAGDPLACIQWHRDTFAIPDGGVRLAGNEQFVNQAFRVGRRAYGLQFHVEVDADLAAAWAPLLPEGATLAPEAVAQAERVGRGILGRLAALAAG